MFRTAGIRDLQGIATAAAVGVMGVFAAVVVFPVPDFLKGSRPSRNHVTIIELSLLSAEAQIAVCQWSEGQRPARPSLLNGWLAQRTTRLFTHLRRPCWLEIRIEELEECSVRP